MARVMASSEGVAAVTGCADGIGGAIALHLVSDSHDLASNDLPSKLADLEAIQIGISLKQRRSTLCDRARIK